MRVGGRATSDHPLAPLSRVHRQRRRSPPLAAQRRPRPRSTEQQQKLSHPKWKKRPTAGVAGGRVEKRVSFVPFVLTVSPRLPADEERTYLDLSAWLASRILAANIHDVSSSMVDGPGEGEEPSKTLLGLSIPSDNIIMARHLFARPQGFCVAGLLYLVQCCQEPKLVRLARAHIRDRAEDEMLRLAATGEGEGEEHAAAASDSGAATAVAAATGSSATRVIDMTFGRMPPLPDALATLGPRVAAAQTSFDRLRRREAEVRSSSTNPWSSSSRPSSLLGVESVVRGLVDLHGSPWVADPHSHVLRLLRRSSSSSSSGGRVDFATFCQLLACVSRTADDTLTYAKLVEARTVDSDGQAMAGTGSAADGNKDGDVNGNFNDNDNGNDNDSDDGASSPDMLSRSALFSTLAQHTGGVMSSSSSSSSSSSVTAPTITSDTGGSGAHTLHRLQCFCDYDPYGDGKPRTEAVVSRGDLRQIIDDILSADDDDAYHSGSIGGGGGGGGGHRQQRRYSAEPESVQMLLDLIDAEESKGPDEVSWGVFDKCWEAAFDE